MGKDSACMASDIQGLDIEQYVNALTGDGRACQTSRTSKNRIQS